MVRSRLPYDDVIMAVFEDDLIQFAFFEVNPMFHFSGADASVTFVLVCLKERTWFKPIFSFIDYIILHYQIGGIFFSIVARGPLIYCYNLHTIINILSISYYCYIYIHFMRFSGKPKAIQGPY